MTDDNTSPAPRDVGTTDVLVSGADAEFMWFALSPDGGPVAWSALAAMVAEGGDRG